MHFLLDCVACCFFFTFFSGHFKSVCGLLESAPAGGVRGWEEVRPGWEAGDIFMTFSWCFLNPCWSSALCTVCVRSPRRSFLCSWTAAGSGACSRIHPGGRRRSRGWVWSCSVYSRSISNGRSGCLRLVSPSGKLSSHMMHTTPSGSWS